MDDLLNTLMGQASAQPSMSPTQPQPKPDGIGEMMGVPDSHETHITIQLKPKKAEKPVVPAKPQAGSSPTPEQIQGINAGETTQLSPLEEQLFRAWAAANGMKPRDVDAADQHYDLRGFYKASHGAILPPGAHFPDTFKQHGHPTFSVESKYSTGPADGGQWLGDGPDARFIPQALPEQVGIPSNAHGPQINLMPEQVPQGLPTNHMYQAPMALGHVPSQPPPDAIQQLISLLGKR